MDRPYIIADQHGRIRYMHPGKLRSIRYARIMLAYYDIPCQGYAEEMAEFLSKYWEVGTEIISRIVPVKEKKDLKKLRKMRERREGVVQLINMVDPPVPCEDMECRLCVEESPKILAGPRIFFGYPSTNPTLGRYISPGWENAVAFEEPSSKHVGKLSLRAFFPDEAYIDGREIRDYLKSLIGSFRPLHSRRQSVGVIKNKKS